MEDWRYVLAKKRVKRIRGFYAHLTTWLVFAAFFIILNLSTGGGFWAIYPIMSWGLGVAFHALGVFGAPGLGKDWEQRKLEEELARLQKEDGYKRPGANTDDRPDAFVEPDEPGLELKEMQKKWRDSDLV